MCLAVPFKIKSIEDNLAVVELDGLSQKISVALIPEVKPGDWVLVHAGFAIHRIDEDEAYQTISLLEEINEETG
jgi:hydrogenase expression/formation protein HypC